MESKERSCILCGTLFLGASPKCPACSVPKQPPTRDELLGRPLTPREKQVADLVKQGLANKEIAFRLRISEASVKVDHLCRGIYPKLGVHSQAELIALLYQQEIAGLRQEIVDLQKQLAQYSSATVPITYQRT